jgi:hypothetical protein
MNLLTGGGYPWFLWPAGAWGIGLFFHFLRTVKGGEPEERREVAREMRRQRHQWKKQVRREKQEWQKQFKPAATPPMPPRPTAVAAAKPAAPAMEAGLQEHLTKARAYRRQIDELVRAAANPQIRANLHSVGQQVDEWMQAIEDLAARIDNFQQNSLIQQDLKSVPAAI